MAADLNKPEITDNNVDILQQLKDNLTAIAAMFDGVSASNIPDESIGLVEDQLKKRFGGAWQLVNLLATGIKSSGLSTPIDLDGDVFCLRRVIENEYALDFNHKANGTRVFPGGAARILFDLDSANQDSAEITMQVAGWGTFGSSVSWQKEFRIGETGVYIDGVEVDPGAYATSSDLATGLADKASVSDLNNGLAGKSDNGHNHNSSYASVSHTHSENLRHSAYKSASQNITGTAQQAINSMVVTLGASESVWSYKVFIEAFSAPPGYVVGTFSWSITGSIPVDSLSFSRVYGRPSNDFELNDADIDTGDLGNYSFGIAPFLSNFITIEGRFRVPAGTPPTLQLNGSLASGDTLIILTGSMEFIRIG